MANGSRGRCNHGATSVTEREQLGLQPRSRLTRECLSRAPRCELVRGHQYPTQQTDLSKAGCACGASGAQWGPLPCRSCVMGIVGPSLCTSASAPRSPHRPSHPAPVCHCGRLATESPTEMREGRRTKPASQASRVSRASSACSICSNKDANFSLSSSRNLGGASLMPGRAAPLPLAEGALSMTSSSPGPYEEHAARS